MKKLIPLAEAEKLMGFTNEDLKEIEREANYTMLMMDLRELRRKLGITQSQLAEKSGIPRPTISMIENGMRNATIQTLMAIASAMGKKLEIRFV